MSLPTTTMPGSALVFLFLPACGLDDFSFCFCSLCQSLYSFINSEAVLSEISGPHYTLSIIVPVHSIIVPLHLL